MEVPLYPLHDNNQQPVPQQQPAPQQQQAQQPTVTSQALELTNVEDDDDLEELYGS